jgi:hypothetical protein
MARELHRTSDDRREHCHNQRRANMVHPQGTKFDLQKSDLQ